MLILPIILVALPTAAILLIVFVNPLVGILALAVAGYIDYQLGKFLRGQIASYIETTDDGINCLTPDGEPIEFDWGTLSAVGIARPAKGRPFLFIYREEGDRLVSVPREYGDFDTLVETVKERIAGSTTFREITLGPGETIQSWLREELGMEGADDSPSD